MSAKVRIELKKGVLKKFFSETVVVLVRKGSYTTLNDIVKVTENLGTKRENPKNLVIRNFGRENGHFFLKKTSSRNLGPRKKFPSPQTRRQVSATGQKGQWTKITPDKIFQTKTPANN